VGSVMLITTSDTGKAIKMTVEAKELNYPEGWRFSNRYFANKYNSTTGAYSQILMFNLYADKVLDLPYCTAD